MQITDFATDHHVDVGKTPNPLDQILRHRPIERPPGDQGHPRRATGEKHRRLARAVAAADQHDLLPGDKVRLEWRRPIMYRGALEILEPLERQSPVASAGGDHDAARLHTLAGCEGD